MSQTIPQLLERKISEAKENLRMAKLGRDKLIANATLQGEMQVSEAEGRLHALQNLEDLDWNLYVKITLGKE